MEQIEPIIREYIKDIVHMSIATCVNNKPWISEVHYAYDDDLNLYFISRPSRRHSLEIAANDQIAGNIIKQHKVGEDVRGVYFEGTIEILKDVKESDAAFQAYNKRLGLDVSILNEQAEENGHRWYKITINKFYLFDELEMDPAGKYE